MNYMNNTVRYRQHHGRKYKTSTRQGRRFLTNSSFINPNLAHYLPYYPYPGVIDNNMNNVSTIQTYYPSPNKN